jgi:hypothetical protein
MARRLFSTQIVDSDAFLDMSASAQNLYFHLGMRADDDGFVGNPKKISRICGANDDDLKILVVKRFLLTFESGVVVVKHWLIHNLIRADLYKETQYKKEKSTLGLNENGAYTELRDGISEIKKIESPEWLKKRRGELRTENGTQSVCKDKLSKDKLREDNLSSFKNKKPKPFYKLTGEEMRYAQNKWWVIPKVGGEWLLFAGSIKNDIEYK